jgi:hypothetical protein
MMGSSPPEGDSNYVSHARSPQKRYAWGETRLLMEYLADRYPGAVWKTNVQIGALAPHIPRPGLSEAAQKLMGKYRRYADAVVITPTELVLVETTIIKAVQKVGQLMDYVLLLPETPELQESLSLPRRAELVSAIPDPRAEALCKQVGVGFVVWEPAWLPDFVALYGQRFRRAPLSDRGQTFVS